MALPLPPRRREPKAHVQTRVPVVVLKQLAKRANAADMTVSEYARKVLTDHVRPKQRTKEAS